MVKDEKRRLGLFMGYYDLNRTDVAEAVNIAPNCATKSYYEGSHTKKAVNDRKVIREYIDMRTNVLRESVKKSVSAIIGEGEVTVVLPTDDKIVVLLDGEVLGWYDPDTGKIGKI